MADSVSVMRLTLFPSLPLSLLAGILAVGGFAPLGFWPLPVLSLAVLFALLARTSSLRAGFAIGLAWGLGFFIVGVSWVFVSLSVYGGMATWLAALATFLFAQCWRCFLPWSVRCRRAGPCRPPGGCCC
jgi:apolipoprotein N-acyltransferase